jgi:hypothetical protein
MLDEDVLANEVVTDALKGVRALHLSIIVISLTILGFGLSPREYRRVTDELTTLSSLSLDGYYQENIFGTLCKEFESGTLRNVKPIILTILRTTCDKAGMTLADDVVQQEPWTFLAWKYYMPDGDKAIVSEYYSYLSDDYRASMEIKIPDADAFRIAVSDMLTQANPLGQGTGRETDFFRGLRLKKISFKEAPQSAAFGQNPFDELLARLNPQSDNSEHPTVLLIGLDLSEPQSDRKLPFLPGHGTFCDYASHQVSAPQSLKQWIQNREAEKAEVLFPNGSTEPLVATRTVWLEFKDLTLREALDKATALARDEERAVSLLGIDVRGSTVALFGGLILTGLAMWLWLSSRHVERLLRRSSATMRAFAWIPLRSERIDRVAATLTLCVVPLLAVLALAIRISKSALSERIILVIGGIMCAVFCWKSLCLLWGVVRNDKTSQGAVQDESGVERSR